MNQRTRRLFLLLLIISISLVGCGTPQPQASPINSPVKASELPKSVIIPAETIQVGTPIEADFDGDGQPEIARAYAPANGGLGGGVIVTKSSPSGESVLWKVEIPSDLKLTELKSKDMLADKIYEILIFTQRDGSIKFPLYVYRWNGGTFIQLKPSGGKLAGQDAFVSDYWPTTLGDVDEDGITEIVPTLEFDPPVEYLEPIVYQWDGANFSFNDFFIVPPRFKP